MIQLSTALLYFLFFVIGLLLLFAHYAFSEFLSAPSAAVQFRVTSLLSISKRVIGVRPFQKPAWRLQLTFRCYKFELAKHIHWCAPCISGSHPGRQLHLKARCIVSKAFGRRKPTRFVIAINGSSSYIIRHQTFVASSLCARFLWPLADKILTCYGSCSICSCTRLEALLVNWSAIYRITELADFLSMINVTCASMLVCCFIQNGAKWLSVGNGSSPTTVSFLGLLCWGHLAACC